METVVNPAATGGAGSDFEFRVGAASPDDDEIWRFLRRFNIVDCDFNLEGGFCISMMRSLLSATALEHDPAVADVTWNTLHALAAARTGTASSFRREDLPAAVLQRHSRSSGYPTAISRLLEDTRVVVDGIRSTIGGKIQICRRELLGQLCQLLEENPLVFVTGEAGSGKSVLAKMAFIVASAGSLGVAFRAESLAGTHINEVFARFGFTIDGLRVQTVSQGRKILWIESVERLMEKPAEDRTAFLDLLRTVKNDPTWKLLITCRDYSAETVRAAFFGGAVCVRDHWQEMTEAEQEWCATLVCNSVEADLETTNRFNIGALNPMAASRPAAFILPALFGKKCPAVIQARLLPTLAKALTHSEGEVVSHVVQGIGAYLWKSDRPLALSCIHALVRQATEEHRHYEEQRQKYPVQTSDENQFHLTQMKHVRESVESGEIGDDNVILQLDWTRWPGQQIAQHLFTILGRQFDDPLAQEFFKNCVMALVLRWKSDYQRRRSRDDAGNNEQELDSRIELQFLTALVQFAANLPEQKANAIFEPLFNASVDLPEKGASVVKRLVIYQPLRTPAANFWHLWQQFAEAYLASSLPAQVDNERSDSNKLLRELFLGSDWGDQRDWKPLQGEEHRIGKLFGSLPPSQVAFEAYSGFLERIGSQALPDAIVGLAAKIPATRESALFSEVAVFHLETILTRVIYGGNRRIRVKSELRLATMSLLDMLVAAGSSAAYKLRDDFLTPG